MLSTEEREAHWRRHLESQYVDYEAYDRNLSDKVSVGGSGFPIAQASKTPKSKEAKENKEKKVKKEKKEKKEEKKSKEVLPPRRITVLGGAAQAAAQAAKAEEAQTPKEAAGDAEEAEEERGSSEGAANVEDSPAAGSSSKPVREIRRAIDLRWSDLCTNLRRLLSQSGRIPAAEVPGRWEQCYGYPLTFPIFGIPDLQELVRQLQPGACTVVSKTDTILQASSDNAFAREQQKWNELEPDEMTRTASEWLIANLEQELKAIRQAIKERRTAEKAANAQVEPLRQEYKALQANQKKGSAQLRSTKLDLDKAEQRMQKFASEAEEKEAQERKLVARIEEARKEQEAVCTESPAALVPQAASASASASASQELQDGPIAPKAAEEPQAPQAVSAEEDFM